MVLPLIALCCTLASCILSFLLQKNCKATSIRFHGKKIEIAKKMVIADVYDVFIKDGQYYAKCGIKNNPVQQVIEIDKAMMASFPNQKGKDDVPVQQVLLYEEGSEPGMCVYSLTPEEIRYKINLQVIQDEKKTMEDIQEASDIISGYYQVRLVLFTLAWVGIYRSPILSILFSVAAITISLRNTIPLRCTKLGKCGIIRKKIGESATGKKADTLPPGYDNWSEESRYLYSLEQQVEAKKQGMDATSDENVDETEEISDSASDDAKDATPLDDEDSIEEDDEEEEGPFFTDEELASEGQEDSEEDLLSDSDGDSEDQEAAFPSDDDDEDNDGFEADGFEADDASDDTTNLAKSDKEAPVVVPTKGQGSKNSSTAKKGGKKTVQSVLDDLMSEDEDIQ